MKKLIFVISFLCIAGNAQAADIWRVAQYGELSKFDQMALISLPVVNLRSPTPLQVQQTNPDPFLQRNPIQAQSSQQPIVVQTPSQQNFGSSWIEWIWTALGGGGILAMLKNAFMPTKQSTPDLSSNKVVDIFNAILHQNSSVIDDPNIRQVVDKLLLQVVQSGIPGQAIQTGASLIPGVGPLASTLEPFIRQKVIEVLQGKVGAVPVATDTSSGDRIGRLEKVVGDLADVLITRFKPDTAKQGTAS